MKLEPDTYPIVHIVIKYFKTEEEAMADRAHDTDIVEFKHETLSALKEIHPNPTKAIVMALQMALKLRRFDERSSGTFFIQSENRKGEFDVPEWKYRPKKGERRSK